MKESIISVLTEASDVLRQLQDDACIIGSSALALSGIAIEQVNDLDLLVSTRDAHFLQKAWNDRGIKDYVPGQGDLFRSTFSRFRFAAMDMEVMGDLEVRKNGNWIPVIVAQHHTIVIGGLKVNIPTLDEQIRILTLFGREKDLTKVRLIENNLSS
ncbi:MAG TPA: hypothetical protein PLX35_07695 [Cyclobacteriaceae bacterium]|nr:hypothetical protein [Cyclobacteriaceae bacterium]